ncbi:MAG: replication associated protein [Avonheates virus SG_146]|uniref:replication associated protein n=1 Tax=Avonheates virus SG_146 TaxID=2914481 RepID=UPI002481C9B7|nr:MAG: replication associated protein [Avonheates virus SG_146]UNI72627.1 MAG: replication associated protein [Avonheates virus SG_146]
MSDSESIPRVLDFDPNDADDLSLSSDVVTLDNGREIITRCIITSFPDDADPKWLIPNTYFTDTSCIDIWCGQFEICPETSKLHFHLYIHFKNKLRMRFTTLRELFTSVLDSVNIVKPRARYSKHSEQCVVNYVLAPEKRADDTLPFIWSCNKRKVDFDESIWQKRNVRSKCDVVEQQLRYIESKPKWWHWDQIVHESDESKLLLATCSWGPKYHAGRHAETPRRIIKNVIVMYGAGGTGKTTLASKWDTRDDEDFHERYYKRNPDDGKFWGGGKTAYRGQRIIHLEEFCGQEAASAFKEICDLDKQGPSVNIKNSGIDLNHDTVIITSNHHPAAWYRHLWAREPKQWHPIARRFTQVWFFPDKRPDGSDNIPSEDVPPYYIDQTDDFSGFSRVYDDAVRHAAGCWPLPIPSDEVTNGLSHASTFKPSIQDTLNASTLRIRGGGPDDEDDPEHHNILEPNDSTDSFEFLLYDIIGSPNNWPSSIRTIFNMSSLTHKTRFALCVFFLNNGVDPDLMYSVMCHRFHLTKKQQFHVKQIIKEFPDSNWKSWNLCLGRKN